MSVHEASFLCALFVMLLTRATNIMQMYTTTLSLLSMLISFPRWRVIFRRHLNIVLCVTCVVNGYIDLFPLATTIKMPPDTCKGWLLWLELALLGVAGILIPVLTPREYVPVDPKVRVV